MFQADNTTKEKVESIVFKQGLSHFKWINPKEIVVAQWVRVKCTFGCSDYGLATCPPHNKPPTLKRN